MHKLKCLNSSAPLSNACYSYTSEVHELKKEVVSYNGTYLCIYLCI